MRGRHDQRIVSVIISLHRGMGAWRWLIAIDECVPNSDDEGILNGNDESVWTARMVSDADGKAEATHSMVPTSNALHPATLKDHCNDCPSEPFILAVIRA